MSQYRDAAGRHDSSAQTAAKIRSAERRRCPKCGRKSALVRIENDYGHGRVCRWDDCQHVAVWTTAL
jgi:ribosomal protein S14